MNFGLIITTSIYIILIGTILYFFIKNEMSLDAMFEDIKKRLNCCIKNKKELVKKIGNDGLVDIKNSLGELEDCEEPLGFPLNICFDGELTEEEIMLRKKLAKQLAEQKHNFIEDGKEKMVIPLEATLFLTKGLNPLVNENGEIIIQIDKKEGNLSTSSSIEEIKMKLESGEIVYEDDPELFEHIRALIDLKKDNNINNTEEETSIKEHEMEVQTKEEEIETKKEESLPISNPQELEDFKDPFGEEEENFDLNNALLAELDSLDLEDKEGLNELDFYKDLEYQIAQIPKLNKENIEGSIEEIFKDKTTISSFFNNLAKTKPIILNENKTIAYIDQFNVHFAIAKLYGLDSSEILNIFKSLEFKETKKLNFAIAKSLEDFLSDIRYQEKTPHKEILEKDGVQIFSFGFDFKLESFKGTFSEDKFDLFRSFPYNNEYKLKGNLSVNGKIPKLITSFEEVEIN